MEPSIIFSFSNSFVLIGWILLIIIPNWKYTATLVLNGVILLLSLIYSTMILATIQDFDVNSFSTLQHVKALFQSDMALTAGWIHYLAFDLFVGLYIVNKGKELGFPRWQYTLCLPFTFMFGPLGLLIFLFIKWRRNKVSQ
ncbi:ABA4-like family protein [uncultured Cyclobacterium sp.]|uniref:ABA4-like family protein n=1 Tax=uncultured Cyclobacterium sp. TaxID=453820 RepID=UPI0030EB475D|tara:strand:+ start:114188 stop:114610 length:423 start_codon:yes stop_codon:yes gene_type:complete